MKNVPKQVLWLEQKVATALQACHQSLRPFLVPLPLKPSDPEKKESWEKYIREAQPLIIKTTLEITGDNIKGMILFFLNSTQIADAHYSGYIDRQWIVDFNHILANERSVDRPFGKNWSGNPISGSPTKLDLIVTRSSLDSMPFFTPEGKIFDVDYCLKADGAIRGEVHLGVTVRATDDKLLQMTPPLPLP
ncbi:MAG: hypothetical protein ACOX0Z_04030 [Candidatus Nanosyncoccaceae bacterium]|jgi:hypothetical protein